MRRFEFAEGTSSKFWEIEQDVADLNIRWGRIGTQGQSQTKTFPDAAKAKTALDKLVSEKTGKGYLEIGSAAVTPSPAATNPAPAPKVVASKPKAASPAPASPAPVPLPQAAPTPAPPPAPAAVETPAQAWVAEIALPQAMQVRALPSRRFPAATVPAPTLSAALAGLRSDLLANCSIHPGRTDAALEPCLEQGWALLQSATAKPGSASLEAHAAMLALLACGGAQFDGTGEKVTPVVDALVAELGLPAALQRLLYAERHFGVRHDWSERRRRMALVHTIEGRLNVLWGVPISAVEWAFRRQLSVASAADYEAAVARIEAELPQLHIERQVVMVLLLPDQPQLSNALALQLAGPTAPQIMHWLQLTATDPQALTAIRKLKLDSYTANFFDQTEMVATLVQERGLEALPLLLPLAAGEQVGLALTGFGVPAAIDALARAASSSKAAMARLQAACARWPHAAIIALAKLAAGGSKEASLASSSLSGLLSAHGAALPALRPQLGAGGEAVLDRLLQQLSGPAEVASLDALPEVLARPPWLQPAKKAQSALALEPLSLAPMEAWEPGVREAALKVGGHRQQRIDKFRADPMALAVDLGFDLSRPNGMAHVHEAAILAIRKQDANALIACWRERRKLLQARKYSSQYLSPESLLALPGDMAVPVWNQIATENDYESSATTLVATHGLRVLPGLLKVLRRNPAENLELALNFGCVEFTSQMARTFARLKTHRANARRWLLKFPEYAACGLIAPALGKAGEARDCAGVALRLLAENGCGELLQRVAARYAQPAVLSALQLVLAESPLDRFPSRRPPLPAFWIPKAWRRPLLAAGPQAGKPLPDSALESIGHMLAFPTNEGLYPGLEQVKAACTPDSLAAFAWDCFSAWLAAGGPSKEGWGLTVLGLFGDDDSARKLTPYLRAWPGEAAHARAVVGLDVLATIGTDVALMQLNGIAQKLKFKGLQDRAQAKINEIAESRGLSTEELEDRLAPDLGLDDHGSLQLDFGPRVFTVAFDETLKPYVREADGTRLADLPKPKKTDDAALSSAATERFKLLKKDARTIASQQITRLELAMCARRRWTLEVFRMFLLEHPLLRHLVQRLVWGVYQVDKDQTSHGGRLLNCFRVAEDYSFSNANDEGCELPVGDDMRIGIPHALELDTQTSAGFGQVFADYELLQPFAQLGRDTYQLTPAEKESKSLQRWKGQKIPTGRVLGLVNKGWRRGNAADGGWIGYFSKPGSNPGQIIELHLEPGIIVGMVDEYPEQQLEDVRIGPASSWGEIEQAEVLGKLDGIAASELIRDLQGLVG